MIYDIIYNDFHLKRNAFQNVTKLEVKNVFSLCFSKNVVEKVLY